MMKLKLLSAMAALSLFAGQAEASIIATENFSYSDGYLADQYGGEGWTTAWVNSAGTAVVTNNRAIITAGPSQQASRPMAYQFKADGRTLWIRFASRVFTDATGDTVKTWGGVGIFNGNTELALIGKANKKSYVWSVIAGGANAYSKVSLKTPSYVFARITFVPDGNDKLDIWVNPADPTTLESTTPDASRTATDLSFDTIRLRAGGSPTTPESWRFDNIIVTDSLADIATPNPAPIILDEPTSITVLPGSATTLSVSAAGYNVGYQWYQNSKKLEESSTLTGVTTSLLSITAAMPENSGNYTCVVTNATGSTTSKSATLTVKAEPTFSSLSPSNNAVSITTNTSISLQVTEGTFLDINAIFMSVNGATVTPTITSNGDMATVTYTPTTPLTSASSQAVKVWIKDTLGNSFTNSWSFYTGFPNLPAVLPGPYNACNGGAGLAIFSTNADAWLGTNYDANANRTFYARFTGTFHNLNGETGTGGAYGGFELYNGSTERLLLGNNYNSLNWSVAVTVPDTDMTPFTPIIFDEWHTVALRVQFRNGAADSATVWLDPDFTKGEDSQVNTPLDFSGDFTFDKIVLRVGNGSANADFTHIMCAETAEGIGFAPSTSPQFYNFSPADGRTGISVHTPISVEVRRNSAGLDASSVVFTIDGTSQTPVVTQSEGKLLITCQPAHSLSGGTLHTCVVNVKDSNGQNYSATWSFTTDMYPSLPITDSSTYTITGGGSGTTLFSSENEWIRGNYTDSSSNTLYIRFSASFDDMNGETAGNGGAYGGLQLYNDGTESTLFGNSWGSVNWQSFYPTGDKEYEFTPVTPIVLGQWHTVVARIDFRPNDLDRVTVFMDPDFTRPESDQLGTPTVFYEDNTFDSIHLRCGDNTATAEYADIRIANTSADVGFAVSTMPQFVNLTPADGASSAGVSSPVSLEVIKGTYTLNSSSVVLKLDGTAVTPAIKASSTNLLISYQPATKFVPGSLHTCDVTVKDSNNTEFTTTWSFTVDLYPVLPLTNNTVQTITNGGLGTTIFSSKNEWVRGNYTETSTNTLYVRFSAAFDYMNGETGAGGAFGGFSFFYGTTEHAMFGNSWGSTNWEIYYPETTYQFTPVIPMVLGEWHTIVGRIDYRSNDLDQVTVYMDPDFSLPEASQSKAPTIFLADNSFDTIHLRCGDGTAKARFKDIYIGNTSSDVGFSVISKITLSLTKTSGTTAALSWVGGGNLEEATAVTGPWTKSESQSNPQVIDMATSTRFFRISK